MSVVSFYCSVRSVSSAPAAARLPSKVFSSYISVSVVMCQTGISEMGPPRALERV